MAKRTRVAEAERAAWRARPAWPVAVLGIDPGTDVAGAGLVVPSEGGAPALLWARSVGSYTRGIEEVLSAAIGSARARGLGLVLVLEEWGAGGPLGIKSWLGLGAARGHWLRAARLALVEGADDVLVASRLHASALTQTWRSMMDIPTSVVDPVTGERRRNEEEDWKRHATRRLAELAPGIWIDTADAAEAALIALYGSRCDDVGRQLPISLLASRGLERPSAKVKKAKRSKTAA